MTSMDHEERPRRKSFLARWFEALTRSRMQHAEHDIHEHLTEDQLREISSAQREREKMDLRSIYH